MRTLRHRPRNTKLSVSLLVFVAVAVGAASALSGCGGKLSSTANRDADGDTSTGNDPDDDGPGTSGTASGTTTSTSTATGTATGTATATATATTTATGNTGNTWDGGPWVPGAAPTSLAAVREAMTGRWIGVARTPWVPAYLVELTFTGTDVHSGTYTSHCIEPGGRCIAMYYGTDADAPTKTFALEDIKANATVDGTIALVFSTDPSNFIPGTLRNLALDASENGLRFEVMNRQYGPIRFDLRRVR